MDDAKLAVVAEVVTRMEKDFGMALDRIQDDIGHINEHIVAQEQAAAKTDYRVSAVEKDVTALNVTVFDPEKGLIHRVKSAENKIDTVQLWQQGATTWLTKLVWEAAKPIIGLLGIGVLIGLSLLVAFLYSIWKLP